MTETARHRVGVLLVAGAALWWSTGGIFIRSVHTDPWTTIFWRSLSAAATMFLFLAIRKRALVFAHFREIGWPGVIIGLCFCGASTCYIPAVLLTSVANTLILQSLSPFIAALLALFLMRERIDLRTMVAMLISAFGVYVMVAQSIGGGSYLGNLLGLAIAVFYAMAVVVTRHRRHVQMLPASCLAAVFAAILSFAVLAFGHRPPWPVASSDLAWLVAFGALQMAVGMVMFTYGVRLIPAAESALLSIIESVGAPIWVYFFFDEDPGIRAIVGGFIVLTTVTVYAALDLRRTALA
jgi:drug/metabolite transporter (DMT)-like permease